MKFLRWETLYAGSLPDQLNSIQPQNNMHNQLYATLQPLVNFLTFPMFLACLLILPLLGTGCASSGKSAIQQPLSVKLGQFESATVEVKSALSKSPDRMDDFIVQLESRIIAKLRARSAFEKVYASAAKDSTADLEIQVIITSIRDVDTFDRVMWGAFAGQAKSKATVNFKEHASGKLIGSGEIEGKSSGGSVMAGTTIEAVDRVADEVVRLVVENL